MKLLLTKFEVAGYFSHVAEALKGEQIQVSKHFERDHPYYNTPESEFLIFRISKWANRQRTKFTRKQLLRKLVFIMIDELVKLFVVLTCGLYFDKIIFSYGEDISGRKYEPFVYKICNTEVIFIFLGSDIRPPSISNKFRNPRSASEIAKIKNEEIRISKVLDTINRHNAVILSYPAYSQYLNREYYDIFSFGIPITPSTIIPSRKEKITICHIPSSKTVKGTTEIIKIFDKLETEFGDKIKTAVFVDISNERVREILAESDVIITEMWSDSPCPFIAIEACAEGCIPVVAGDYAVQFKEIYESSFVPPYPYVAPEEVFNAVRELIIDDQKREVLHSACRTYYSTNHTSKRFASKMLDFLNRERRETCIKFNPSDSLTKL